MRVLRPPVAERSPDSSRRYMSICQHMRPTLDMIASVFLNKIIPAGFNIDSDLIPETLQLYRYVSIVFPTTYCRGLR